MIDQIIGFITEHWVEIVAILGAVNIAASIIVEWTPWKWDNEALVRIRQGFLFLAGRVKAARHVVKGKSKAEISLAELDRLSEEFFEKGRSGLQIMEREGYFVSGPVLDKMIERGSIAADKDTK